MATDDRSVHLVGAGLAGPLLALFLARRGFRVTIHERRPDMRSVEVPAGRSINLALAARGIRALAAVGIMDRIRPLLVPMAGRMIHDEQGGVRLQPYGRTPDEVIHSVSRAELNVRLMEAAEETGRVRIRFEERCRGVDMDRGELLLEGSGGTRTRTAFETVIGTDGSASSVRDSLVAHTGGSCREEPLEHGYKELSIPPASAGGFRIEGEALHIWPRGEFMLIALPNLDGSFTVTLFLPVRGPESFESLDSAAAASAFFERRFPDARPLLTRLEEEFAANPTGHLLTVRCRPWHEGGRVLLLGDAAHAIVPFHGQGMNCAFEDCVVLDRILDEEGGDLARTFRRFEQERVPDAEAIADMALENYVEMRSTVRDPKFHLKKDVAWRLEERHPDRFVPRYSLVMFHHVPYHLARERGTVQAVLLEDLCSGIDEAGEIDLDRADRLVRQRLEPLPDAPGAWTGRSGG